MDFGMATGAGLMMARDDIKWYMDRKARKKAAKQAWEHQKRVLQKQLQWRAADATEAMEQTGMHRLALLGIGQSADAGPSIPVGQFMGDSGGGDMLARALDSPSEDEKALLDANLAIKEKQKESIELENEKSRLDLAQRKSTGWLKATGDPIIDWMNEDGLMNTGNQTNMNQPQGTGGNSPVEVVPREVTASGGLGIEAGMAAFEKLKIDWEGFVYVVPADSQDIEENAFIKGIYYPRKAKGWAAGTVRKFGDILNKVKPPPPGHRYVFRRLSGQFQLISDEQFFKEQAGKQDISERRRKGRRGERRKGQARRVGRRVGSFTPY